MTSHGVSPTDGNQSADCQSADCQSGDSLNADCQSGDSLNAGNLSADCLANVGDQGFGVYVHVPFCARRCGYCDFNTYTLDQTQARGGYVDAVRREIQLAAQTMGGAVGKVDTVFFGGGTPTMLSAAELAAILAEIGRVWPLAEGAEVTTEANPESVDLAKLRELRAAGFKRISLGAQSVAPNVLAVLERQHTPKRAMAAAQEAKLAGFAQVNLDLIYGTPGETERDFADSLRAVLSVGVDHVSAYALTVEQGTRLAARMRRGEVPYPDDDVAADRYLQADRVLTEAGFSWYEVSNWAKGDAGRCRHNLGYWAGGDWWGFGPGAHSHVGGVRWWNVKNPGDYVARLSRGVSPVAGRESLTAAQRRMETVMLELRLATGLDTGLLDSHGRRAAVDAAERGLLDSAELAGGRAVLTIRGRLLADAVTRDLLGPA